MSMPITTDEKPGCNRLLPDAKEKSGQVEHAPLSARPACPQVGCRESKQMLSGAMPKDLSFQPTEDRSVPHLICNQSFTHEGGPELLKPGFERHTSPVRGDASNSKSPEEPNRGENNETKTGKLRFQPSTKPLHQGWEATTRHGQRNEAEALLRTMLSKSGLHQIMSVSDARV
ncbi:unnamed protein product [Rhizoctonia solani]|uniref:Uncharacterized protein n=1 Tax=Rhizoctonia solani TaxID=456999 RepID=A0A8H3CDC9_9AGAM|nr:unnamed protein product [Rhizoctonia solani]CAE6480042.1 unnamed protein product [Rhizoctonia solani]